jgi:hypothetical protein
MLARRSFRLGEVNRRQAAVGEGKGDARRGMGRQSGQAGGQNRAADAAGRAGAALGATGMRRLCLPDVVRDRRRRVAGRKLRIVGLLLMLLMLLMRRHGVRRLRMRARDHGGRHALAGQGQQEQPDDQRAQERVHQNILACRLGAAALADVE